MNNFKSLLQGWGAEGMKGAQYFVPDMLFNLNYWSHDARVDEKYFHFTSLLEGKHILLDELMWRFCPLKSGDDMPPRQFCRNGWLYRFNLATRRADSARTRLSWISWTSSFRVRFSTR